MLKATAHPLIQVNIPEVLEPGGGTTTSNNIRGKDGEVPEGVAPKV